jgi:hypothetical protein
MRIASIIVSWICWLIAAFYWLFLALVSFYPALMARSDPRQPVDQLFLFTGIGCIVVGFVLWFVRKRIWFDSSRPVGPGFLIYLLPLYFGALCAVVGPYLEFIIWGSEGLFFRAGFVVTALLMVLVFPRLPAKRQAEQAVPPNGP